MSRATMTLNITEERLVERIDADRRRELAPPKPKRVLPPEHVWLNGKLYVPSDAPRKAAEQAFTPLPMDEEANTPEALVRPSWRPKERERFGFPRSRRGGRG